jgi:cell filamentation protein
MYNNYQYIDPDYTYTDPKTGILRNLGGINDKNDLLFFESAAVLKRTKELAKKPLNITGSETLLKIHAYLFQDVYEWAGQKRTVEISKQGKPFFLTGYFDTGFAYIDSLIAGYRKIDKRDGNGQAQREFIRLLALEKGYVLNLNPPENAGVYERYMSGTIEGDVEKLQSLIFELLGGELEGEE